MTSVHRISVTMRGYRTSSLSSAETMSSRIDALAVRRLVSEHRSLRFHRRISELLADDFAYDEHAALNRVRLRFLAFPRQKPGPCEKTRSLRRVELDAREPVGVGGGKGIRRE